MLMADYSRPSWFAAVLARGNFFHEVPFSNLFHEVFSLGAIMKKILPEDLVVIGF